MSVCKWLAAVAVVAVLAVGSARAGDNGDGTWTVDPGDTLCKIAQAKYGSESKWRDIYEKNKDVIGNNPNNIIVGQKLKLP